MHDASVRNSDSNENSTTDVKTSLEGRPIFTIANSCSIASKLTAKDTYKDDISLRFLVKLYQYSAKVGSNEVLVFRYCA